MIFASKKLKSTFKFYYCENTHNYVALSDVELRNYTKKIPVCERNLR